MLSNRLKYEPFNNKVPMSTFSKLRARQFIQESSELELLDCLICNQNEFQILSETDRYGFYYPTGICINCGNVQQSKYYKHLDVKLFYSKYYRDIYERISPRQRFMRQFKLGKHILDYTLDEIQGKRVLEVGTGAGGIVSFFKTKGYSALGLDYDTKYINLGLRCGTNLKKGGLEVLAKIEKFDLIILCHTLEHITNLQKFLENISWHLSAHGIIYIEVPSLHIINLYYQGDFLHYFQNAHTVHFSNGSFQNLLNICGYEEIKGDTFIRSIIRYTGKKKDISPCYISNLDLVTQIEKEYGV